ncbi:MAG: acetate--CoA ligase family protein [Bradymonadales bacterium]|nr:acetate--CoA ligase family protein [Bradymonadales bacterium]
MQQPVSQDDEAASQVNPEAAGLIAHTLEQTVAEGRLSLMEHELLPFFERLGCPLPSYQVLGREPDEQAAIRPNLLGRPGVLKVISPQILHKTDVGGVTFVDEVQPASVASHAAAMLAGLPEALASSVRGFLLEERIPYQPGPGRELLLGIRCSSEFGAVLTLGFGGTYVEALDAALLTGQSTVVIHPSLTPTPVARQKLERSLFFRWISGSIRGVEPLTTPEQLHLDLGRWMNALLQLVRAVEAAGQRVEECEINPLVWAGGWIPVDALARLGPPLPPRRSFAADNLRRALHPKSVAIVGVSTRMNIGRVILRSLLDAGFPADRIFVIRPDGAEIDGRPSVVDLAHLPEPVDLLVLAVAATSVPAILEEVLQTGAARSVLLVSGGMGETEGGKSIQQRIFDLLETSDRSQRPVLIGNNSLGLVSLADRVDTLFIPKEKLPRIRTGLHNVALVSQSGAFMITRISKLVHLSPAYQVSVGNQLDARLSDFVEILREDPNIQTFAVYIEGLRPGDGVRLGQTIAQLVGEGRDVIVYKAGRSSLGQTATAGHTASVAGDYRLFAELMADSGAMVAEDFWEFLHLLQLSASLAGKELSGRRVAMMSNAGFETVGMADNYSGADYHLEPARFQDSTRRRLAEILVQAKIDHLVTLANPLDLTPMANDEVHASCIDAIMQDPGVDIGLFCNVPLTPSIQSLPPGLLPRDSYDSEHGYARRVIELFHRSDKPMVFVLDAGRHYEPMFHYLGQHGLPVFRSADQAIRIVGRYLEARLGHRQR